MSSGNVERPIGQVMVELQRRIDRLTLANARLEETAQKSLLDCQRLRAERNEARQCVINARQNEAMLRSKLLEAQQKLYATIAGKPSGADVDAMQREIESATRANSSLRNQLQSERFVVSNVTRQRDEFRQRVAELTSTLNAITTKQPAPVTSQPTQPGGPWDVLEQRARDEGKQLAMKIDGRVCRQLGIPAIHAVPNNPGDPKGFQRVSWDGDEVLLIGKRVVGPNAVNRPEFMKMVLDEADRLHHCRVSELRADLVNTLFDYVRDIDRAGPQHVIEGSLVGIAARCFHYFERLPEVPF